MGKFLARAEFSPPRFGERLICHEWDPERWRTLSPRGWEKWGVQGGCGGCPPPQNLKKGRAVNPCSPATSGTQNAGKPSANEGGQTWGSRVAVEGVPHKTLKGASCQPLQPRHEWDPERWRTISPRGRANGGGGDGAPSLYKCRFLSGMNLTNGPLVVSSSPKNKEERTMTKESL